MSCICNDDYKPTKKGRQEKTPRNEFHVKEYEGKGLTTASIPRKLHLKGQLTDSPNFSPLCEATLSETNIADIRLGCVHIMLQTAP